MVNGFARAVTAALLLVAVPTAGHAQQVPASEPAPPAPAAPPATTSPEVVPAVAPAAPAAPAVAPPAASARVHVRATKSGVIVARITQRMVVAGSGGIAEGIAWKDLCIAPCEFEIEPGLHEIMVKGEGHLPAVRQFNLAPGDQYLVAKPGSRGFRLVGVMAVSLGLGAMVLGGLFMALPPRDKFNATTLEFEEGSKPGWALPVLLGGVGLTGLGIGMVMVGGSSLDQESGPQQSSGGMIPRAVSYRTSF